MYSIRIYPRYAISIASSGGTLWQFTPISTSLQSSSNTWDNYIRWDLRHTTPTGTNLKNRFCPKHASEDICLKRAHATKTAAFGKISSISFNSRTRRSAFVLSLPVASQNQLANSSRGDVSPNAWYTVYTLKPSLYSNSEGRNKDIQYMPTHATARSIW